MSSTPVIVADDLTKTFGSFRALDGFNLTVNAGEVMGFLGPNGAGKSTTVRILLGLIKATSGTAQLFGQDPWRDAVAIHQRLTYVPGDVTLWPGLTGGQSIDILTRAHGGANPQRRAAMIERFNLDPSKKFRTYSKGNRQKVSLVAALSVDAELLILDEPTSGLDPLMEAVFQEAIRERVQDGCTVLLSSHILSEVETLADRVTIIRAGKTVSTGTLADLRQHTRTSVHAVTAAPPNGLESLAVADLATHDVDGLTDVQASVDNDDLDRVIGALHAAGLRTLTVTPPSLDELFRDAYSTDAGNEATAVAR